MPSGKTARLSVRSVRKAAIWQSNTARTPNTVQPLHTCHPDRTHVTYP